MKRTERPDTAACSHNWESVPGMSNTFRCSLCRAAGHTNRALRVPYLRKIGANPTPEQVAARKLANTVQPYTCQVRTRTKGGRVVCRRPAYAAGGCCSLHAPLRPGETED